MMNNKLNDFIHKISVIEKSLSREDFLSFLNDLKNAKNKAEYIQIVEGKYEVCLK